VVRKPEKGKIAAGGRGKRLILKSFFGIELSASLGAHLGPWLLRFTSSLGMRARYPFSEVDSCAVETMNDGEPRH
jgi:hypothetical protein